MTGGNSFYKSTLLRAESTQTVKNSVVPPHGFNAAEGFFVIAHRGASHYAPENTMAAFKKAHLMKADMIELDVLLTRDGVPVVLHDTTLNRTTTGSGAVNSHLSRDLAELDAGSWFDPSFSGERIPTLESVMNWARDTIALNIEIKGRSSDIKTAHRVEEIVIDLIEHYNMRSTVLVSSFNRSVLHRLKQMEPGIATALLNGQYSYGTRRGLRRMKKIGADGLNLLPRQMNEPLMNRLKQSGTPVWVYTLNKESDMRRVIRKGATGIFSNRPDLLRSVVIDEFQ